MKILCIEDGSVDLEALENIKDGGVLLYRKGSTPPHVIEISKKDVYQEEAFVLRSKIEAMANTMRSLVREWAEEIKNKELVKTMLVEFYDTMKTYGINFL